jgi:hypothetical protein
MNQNNRKEVDEQIERALLMMKYNTSKTLSENKENIKPLLKEDGKVAAATIGSGAVGAGLGAAAIPSSMSIASGGAGVVAGTTNLAAGVATALGTSFTVGAAIVGGAAAMAVIPLAYWFIRKDTGAASSVKAIFQMCSTNPQIAKLERKISDSEIRNIADEIYDAINYSTLGFMAGTDEEKLFAAFQNVSTGTAADICALYSRYTSTRGELYDDIDGDIDSPDEWEQIYRPLRNCVEDSLRDLEDKNPCKENETLDPKTKKCVPISPNPDPGPTPGPGGCKDFPFKRGCKNSKIKDVQGCLGGLTADGILGPKTQKALEDAGYSVPLTKSDYDKIMAKCGQGNTDTTSTTTQLPPTYVDVVN